jgi:hypothetical protein
VLTNDVAALMRVQMRLLLLESVQLVSEVTTPGLQAESLPSLAPQSIEPVLSRTTATSRPTVFLVWAETEMLMLLTPTSCMKVIGTVACAWKFTVDAVKSAFAGTGVIVTLVPSAVDGKLAVK